MAQVEVVEAGAPDVDGLATFLRAAWAEAGPGTPGFAGATDEVIAEISQPAAIRARLGGPERRMYVARADGDVIGFAATRRVDATTIELAGIIVRAAETGRGTGGRLVDAAIRAAREAGFGRMLVRTEVTNDVAVGFYERHGFVRGEATVEQVEGQGVDVVELSLAL